jgi:hypothetical protein
MSREPLSGVRARSKVLSIAWFLASVLALFAVENIWLDPWLGSKSSHLPTLVPDPQSGLWFLAFVLVVIFCVLLVCAQILVALDRAIPLLMRIGTGFASLFALLMCVLWFQVTSGVSTVPSFRLLSERHSVTLTWKASHSPVSGYNVYRSTGPGGPYTRINSDLVPGLTYKDQDVESGATYYYVTKAVNAKGQESIGSNETSAKVP